MTTTSHFARVMTSCAVLCIASSVFAQNRTAATQDSGQPKGQKNMEAMSKCPVISGTLKDASDRHTAAGGMSNRDWWPNQLNLHILHQNSPMGNPMGEDFDYTLRSSRRWTWML